MKKTRPFLVVIVLMVLASLALAFTVDVSLQDQPGVRLKLPDQLGDWKGNELRYCHNPKCKKDLKLNDLTGDKTACPSCGEPLFTMSLEEFEALPKDTEFIKSLYSNTAGDEVYVAIVLSGKDQSSIHRPQRCLVGQGHEILDHQSLRAPLSDGGSVDLMVLKCIKTFQMEKGPYVYPSYYAYWFVGQNRETPYHLTRMFYLAWDRVVHSVAHKWAYVAISGHRDENSDAYKDRIKEFTSLLHKAIVLTPDEKKAPAPGA